MNQSVATSIQQKTELELRGIESFYKNKYDTYE